MQIADLMGQYQQTNTGTERFSGTKGIESLVSSLRSLTKGNIFEGTVSSMKNGQVTLALSNGQQVTARMEGKVSLSVGQSMFFQVKSNDGTQIAIRPFVMDGTGVNYTLLQALSAAGLPKEPKYLSMVNRMMEEQMPIDRSSLQQMARLAASHGEINVQTLIQMQKLGIPITAESAAQFENYLDDRQAITVEMEQFMEELPSALQGEGMTTESMRQMGGEILSVLTENLPELPEAAIQMIAAQESRGLSGEMGVENQLQETAGEQQTGKVVFQEAETAETGNTSGNVPTAESTEGILMEELSGDPAAAHTLRAVLEPGQIENLNRMMGKLLGMESLHYTKNSGVVQVLDDFKQVLSDSLPMERGQLTKLFSSKEFHALLKDTLEQQWMIKPEELAEGDDKVGKLYERLNHQLSRMESALKASGQENPRFIQMAADIRGNVEFMNQINQAYTYAQIPLKMSGKNASAELYVYTNKKALEEGDKDLTAFLHLDMDNLGPTDVSVRMRNREVSTNFYLENDEAYELIENNLVILEGRLAKKGYHCSLSVTNEAKHVNFVEDFLKKDQPSAGQLHRYSFDVRA